MKPTMVSAGRRYAAKFIAAILLASATSVLAHEASGEGRVPLPNEVFEGKGEQCVHDEDFMRRNHMSLILHQRDETMHEGIRTRKYSLKNCINCHADPKTNSVLGENGFCQSCHTYASVTIDCFSCHSSAPEKGVEPTLGRAPASNPHVREQVSFKPVANLTDAERLELVNVSLPVSGNLNMQGEMPQ